LAANRGPSLPRLPGSATISPRAAAQAAAHAPVAGRVHGSTLRARTASNSQPDLGLVLPHWVGSFTTQGTTYPYAVVGADPALGQTTTIPTVVIPYRLVLSDGTVLDASSDAIDGTTALDGVMSSPVFHDAPFSAGSTSLGVTQWGDAVLRAEFWGRRPASDGYHVLLSPTVQPTVTLNVPADKGYSILDTGSGRMVGLIDSAWADSALTSTMVNEGVTPDKLAVNLFSEVILYGLIGASSSGYHSALDLGATTGIAGLQTYIQTAYFGPTSEFSANQPNFPGTGVLGHEVAEWVMDPAAFNLVPGWQLPQAPGWCYSGFLEVGDPLEAEPDALQIPVSGAPYTFPDVALLPYFSRTSSMPSVNGWETLLGTSTKPSVPCSFGLFATGVFTYTDDTGTTPIPTALASINNTHDALLYYIFEGALYAFQISGFDPVGGTFGTTSPITVPIPGDAGSSYTTVPTGINDAGTVAGYFVDESGATHGFVEQSGQYTTVDVPGAVSTTVFGLNNGATPDLVGQFFDAKGAGHGFVRHGGQFIRFDAPSASNTRVNAINDHGQLVGAYDSGGPQSGFEATLADDGCISGFVTVNAPGSANSQATVSTELLGIGNTGEIIGTQTVTDATGYGYTLGVDVVDGIFEVLGTGHDSDGSVQTIPRAINSDGVIVGQGTDLSGTFATYWVPYNLASSTSASGMASMTLPTQLPVPTATASQ